MDRLRDKVVVITGASSGLGREAALQLAERGCRLVLAARRAGELEDTAGECRELGGDAFAVETDVTREEEVERLAEAALRRWGRIDVWLNNAGVTLFARLEEGAFEDHRRVIETNLDGAILGARAVLPIFRRQGWGTLINVGSVLSKIGHPFVPAYAISKFGLRGLSEALRAEMADYPDVHVCTILPYAIDTPHFEAGGNLIGREARAMPPVQSPEKVARAIVGLIERPRRELHVPRAVVLGLALHWMFPRTTERLLLHALRKFHFGAAEPRSEGNLFAPAAGEGTVHGERPPRLGAAAFVAWAARELVRIEVQAARRRVQRWRAPAVTS